MACPSPHWLSDHSTPLSSVQLIIPALMQQLLIQRPVLVLLPRTHTHVRPVFGIRSRQRSLVTSTSWQSWFAGSPRKQVPTCSS